jgi:hypothetical protein
VAKIQVVDEARLYVTEPGDPDDRWDRDNTATEHYIRGIRVVGEKDYYDLQTAFDIDPKRPYFLMYAIYSTGDSFGHDEGRIEYVGLFEELEFAHENVARIRRHNEIYQQLNDRWYRSSKQMSKEQLKKLEKSFEPYTVRLVTEDGQEYDVHVPWHGYFERLIDVEVEPVLAR